MSTLTGTPTGSQRAAVEEPDPAPARAGAFRRHAPRLVPAWAITAACAIAYVIAAPPSTDLSAAAYRSELFARAGLTLWDNSWYGGHHLLAYSLLAPGLGALLGVQLLAALSMTAATALFAALIAGRFPERATRVAGVWFAIGASVALIANRVPFDLGLAIGLGALVCAQRRHRAVSLVLAALCAVASPVAGAFLALAALAWALHRRPPWHPLALCAAACLPVAALTLAFPEGGSEPFVASSFYPALVGVLAVAALTPPEHALVRTGALLYAATLIGAYAVPSAFGGNADRLGALLAGPVAACVLISARQAAARQASARQAAARQASARQAAGARVRAHIRVRPRVRARALIAMAPFLLYWQANAPVADFLSAAEDPAVSASYYAPLLAELRALGIGYGARPARIEVVLTRDHGEARWVAPHVMIARGWERQLDDYRNALFYEPSVPFTAARYRAWLRQQAISYVALPDAPLDYAAKAEARLLRDSPPPGYLREIWRSRHWRLFAVSDPAPLAEPPARLTSLGTDSFTLSAPGTGSFVVRVHFTPYWALAGGAGCVRRAAGDWTEVQAARAGSLRVVIAFSLGRVFDHGRRCRVAV